MELLIGQSLDDSFSALIRFRLILTLCRGSRCFAVKQVDLTQEFNF